MSNCIEITGKKVQCTRKAVNYNRCTQHYNIYIKKTNNTCDCNESKISHNSESNISEFKLDSESLQKLESFTPLIQICKQINHTVNSFVNSVYRKNRENLQELIRVVYTQNLDSRKHTDFQSDVYCGLVCIAECIRDYRDGSNVKIEVFNSRCFPHRKHYTVEKAIVKANLNITDIYKMIDYCVSLNIKSFRLTSELLPRYNDPEVSKYDILQFEPELIRVGEYIKERNMQVLAHPNQTVNIASPDLDTLENSVRELDMHCKIFDLMKLDFTAVCIIHGGGLYSDKEATIQTWISRFKSLPENIRNRIVLENCERAFNIFDCLYISSQTGIPVVFDIHHYICYDLLYDNIQSKSETIRGFSTKPEYFLHEVCKTWKNRNIIMHISSQRPDSRIGAHSDFIEKIPDWFIDFVRVNKYKIYLEIEAKSKEKAILELRQKYSWLM